MSIHLLPSKNVPTNYSSAAGPNQSHSRLFQAYRTGDNNSQSLKKAYNMDDQQRRLKREHHSLYKESSQQSSLFEKGLKKVTPLPKEGPAPETIKREYRNKETYNVIKPTPVVQNKLTDGGVRKIYLYDQRKQSNPFRTGSESRKKILKDCNKESQRSSEVFLVKKLATHKGSHSEWHNSVTTVSLTKKQNAVNQQNRGKVEEDKPKSGIREATKNKSSMTGSEGGITLRGDRKAEQIDFKQDYYRKYSRLENSQSGYLTSRCR